MADPQAAPATAPQGQRRVHDRQDLRQGPLAREPRRAAVVPAHRAAAGRDRPAHARRADRARRLRVRADGHGDRESRPTRRCSWSRRRRPGSSRSAACPPSSCSRSSRSHCPTVLFPYVARDHRGRRDRAPASRRCISRRSTSRCSTSSSSRRCSTGGAGGELTRRSHCIGERMTRADRRRRIGARAALGVLVPASVAATSALAADFRVTAEAPTVLYDAPSAKAKPLFVYGRDVPIEVHRHGRRLDQGARRRRHDRLGRRRRARRPAHAGRARAASPTCAPSPTTPRRSCFAPSRTCCSSSPSRRRRRRRPRCPAGSKVRHRDGQTGYVRIAQVFGL